MLECLKFPFTLDDLMNAETYIATYWDQKYKISIEEEYYGNDKKRLPWKSETTQFIIMS